MGAGIALLHGWHIWPDFQREEPVDAEQFRRLAVDLYVPPNGVGYWESALRDPSDTAFIATAANIAAREPFVVDILYGDQDGGQRTISRFIVLPAGDEGWYTQAPRHWTIDRPAPR